MKKTGRRWAISALCTGMLAALLLTGCNSNDRSFVSNVSLNENGELVLQYSDGSEENLGVIAGQDGQDGQDGKDGRDGEKGEKGDVGETGATGSDGKDGSLIITDESIGLSAAIAKGLRSAVSITCNFTKSSGFYPGYGSSGSTSSYSSEGSGVIYRLDSSTGDAIILTNYHVVYDSSSMTENGVSDDITVYLYGSELEEMGIEATYVGGSLYYDIAVLRVEGSRLLMDSDAVEATLADSDQIAVGESAIAIGNAEGYGISACSGIISVDSEHITMTAADNKTSVSFRVMRVDAAVNSGNSGGGLFNEEGELIGIVNAKVVDSGVENIGYAIPSNVAVSVAENILFYCLESELETVQRCILGISVSTDESRAVYDAETGKIRIEEKVSVYEVTADSLADGVLQTGDILVSATHEGKTHMITRQYHMIDLMLNVRVGETLALTVLRDGVSTDVFLTVTEECLISY